MFEYVMIVPDFLTQPAFVILAGFSSCPAPPPAVIEVRLRTEPTVYILDATAAEITRMTGHSGKMPDGSQAIPLGVTLGGMAHGYETVFREKKQGGDACLSLEKVVLDIHYAPKVYMAKEYHRICKPELTKAHEDRHVAADIKIQTKHLPALKKALAAAVRAIDTRTPVPEAQVAERKLKIRQSIKDAMEPARAKVKAERSKKHAEYDSPENSAREGKVTCKMPEDWWGKFLWWCCGGLI